MTSKAVQTPEELLVIICQCLCLEWPTKWDRVSHIWVFDSSLAQCSLTCRRWAARIRPAVFRNITLTSEKKARAFSALVRYSVNVPASLRDIVRHLKLEMDDTSRPWMYYVWALLRDGILTNLDRLDLQIVGADNSAKPQVVRRKGEVLLDIGLPRTLPSTHPVYLDTLQLWNIQFRSHANFLRRVSLHSPRHIICSNVQWPEESMVLPPLEHPRLGRSPLTFRASEEVSVKDFPSVVPFLWCMVTTQLSGPGATQRLLYISPAQIDAVMDIIHLFSDESEYRRFGISEWGLSRRECKLQVLIGKS